MATRSALAPLAVVFALAASPLACGDSDPAAPAPETDSGSDASDSSLDSTPPDTGTDTTIPDVPADVTIDSPVDVSDSGLDAGSDTAVGDGASDSKLDGGTETSGETGDGGTSVDLLACGTATCSTLTQMCCVDDTVTPTTAVCTSSSGTCASTASEFDCDGSEDCAGDICCASDGGGSYCDVACVTGDHKMCHGVGECGSSESCRSCPLGPASYGVCLLSTATCPW